MKKYRGLGFLLGCLLLCGFAWTDETVIGDGQSLTQVRHIHSFQNLEVADALIVHIHTGAQYKVVVTADSNLQPYLKTQVSGGTLYLSTKSGYHLSTKKALRVDVSLPDLKALTISGSAVVDLMDVPVQRVNVLGNSTVILKNPRQLAVLDVAGSASVHAIELSTKDLTIHSSGSANLVLTGHAKTSELTASGSTLVDAKKLKTDTTKVSIAGSGRVDVWAQSNLQVEVEGSGDVHYYGHPTVTQRITGSGTLVAETT